MISRTSIAASNGDAGGSHLKDWTSRELFRADPTDELKSIHELMSDEVHDDEFGVSGRHLGDRDRHSGIVHAGIAAPGVKQDPGRGIGRRLVASVIDR